MNGVFKRKTDGEREREKEEKEQMKNKNVLWWKQKIRNQGPFLTPLNISITIQRQIYHELVKFKFYGPSFAQVLFQDPKEKTELSVLIVMFLFLFNLKIIYLFIWLCQVLAMSCRIFQFRYVGSSSLTRTRTQASCIGSVESQKQDHLGVQPKVF